MAAKFFVILSLAMAASALPLVPVKLAFAEHEAPAHYDFEYSVHDGHSGDVKQQKESRAGDAVHGSYSLVQPDGVHRIVEYTYDKEHGFNAIVRCEGHPIESPRPAKITYSSPVAYSAPIAKDAYVAPVAKVAYASAPLTHITFSSPAISYHH